MDGLEAGPRMKIPAVRRPTGTHPINPCNLWTALYTQAYVIATIAQAHISAGSPICRGWVLLRGSLPGTGHSRLGVGRRRKFGIDGFVTTHRA